MKSERKWLYLVVSEFPYGLGEIFLREEIGILSREFELVYLVIPDVSRIKDGRYYNSLTENVIVCKLESRSRILDRLITFKKVLSEYYRVERNIALANTVKTNRLSLLKTIWGYWALSNSFKRQFKVLLAKHRHQPRQVTFYSYWFFYPTLALAEIKEKTPHYRVISRMHGWDCFFERNRQNYLPLRPYSINRLDLLASISEAGMIYTANKLNGFIDSSKLTFSRLGISCSQVILRGSDESDDTFLLTSLAYLTPVKRIDRIAEALLNWTGKKIKWEHIGIAFDKNRRFEDSVNEKFKGHPSVSVSFKGELSQSEIYEYFASSSPDLLICTSESEGIPVSMMEAMAHGIPVLSVDVGGVHEIVAHRKNGLLIPAAATDHEIRLALEEFIAFSPETKHAMRQNAVKTYVEKFNAEKNYTEFVQTVLKNK